MTKTRTRLKRFIFGFTAFLIAFLSVFVFVPVRSFASSVMLNIQNRTDPVRYGYISIYKYDGDTWVSVFYSYASSSVSSVSLDDSFIYRISISSNYKFDVNYDVISTDFNSPTHLSSNWLNFGRMGTTSSTVYYYFTLPNYVPSTPTPSPTPTPTPTPTPNPYGNELGQVTEINNHIFSAIGQTATAANSAGFWTSFLFIGLPLILVVFGIIAYAISGGDN